MKSIVTYDLAQEITKLPANTRISEDAESQNQVEKNLPSAIPAFTYLGSFAPFLLYILIGLGSCTVVFLRRLAINSRF